MMVGLKRLLFIVMGVSQLVTIFGCAGPIAKSAVIPPSSAPPAVPAGQASLTFSFDGMDIKTLRARYNDTDIVNFGVQIGDKTYKVTKELGDLKRGFATINDVKLNVAESDIRSDSDIIVSYVVTNSGHAHYEDLQAMTKDIIDIINVIGPTAVNDLLTRIHKWGFADCDGPVAIGQKKFKKADLATASYEDPPFPGTESSWGCGKSSEYVAKWSITRS